MVSASAGFLASSLSSSKKGARVQTCQTTTNTQASTSQLIFSQATQIDFDIIEGNVIKSVISQPDLIRMLGTGQKSTTSLS